jgi:hypothetical protein
MPIEMNPLKENNLKNNSVSPVLTVSLQNRIPALPQTAWESLFIGFPNAEKQFLQLSERAEEKKGSFSTILAIQDQKPVLLLPIYQIEYPSQQKNDWKEKRLLQLARFFSAQKMTDVGFVGISAEQIGCDFTNSSDVIEAAWHVALETLEQFAVQSKIGLICISASDSEQSQLLQAQSFKNYVSISANSSLEKQDHSVLFFAAKLSPWRWLFPMLEQQILHLMQAKDEIKTLGPKNRIR